MISIFVGYMNTKSTVTYFVLWNSVELLFVSEVQAFGHCHSAPVVPWRSIFRSTRMLLRTTCRWSLHWLHVQNWASLCLKFEVCRSFSRLCTRRLRFGLSPLCWSLFASQVSFCLLISRWFIWSQICYPNKSNCLSCFWFTIQFEKARNDALTDVPLLWHLVALLVSSCVFQPRFFCRLVLPVHCTRGTDHGPVLHLQDVASGLLDRNDQVVGFRTLLWSYRRGFRELSELFTGMARAQAMLICCKRSWNRWCLINL